MEHSFWGFCCSMKACAITFIYKKKLKSLCKRFGQISASFFKWCRRFERKIYFDQNFGAWLGKQYICLHCFFDLKLIYKNNKQIYIRGLIGLNISQVYISTFTLLYKEESPTLHSWKLLFDSVCIMNNHYSMIGHWWTIKTLERKNIENCQYFVC